MSATDYLVLRVGNPENITGLLGFFN